MLKYRRLWRLAIRPIVPGLHHQLYPNEFVNSSLAWDDLDVTFMKLGRTTMSIFMIFYSKMSMLKGGAKTNIIIILIIHAYTSAILDIGLYRSFLENHFSVANLLVFNAMTSSSASLTRMEISTTTHSISCNPIIPSRNLYTITMPRKAQKRQ